MNAITDEKGLIVKGSRQGDAVGVGETFWGYIIHKGKNARDRAAIGEVAATTGSAFFGLLAYGQWLLPGLAGNAASLSLKIGTTTVFFMFSGLLYLIARRGLSSEVHVDVKRRQLRTVRRNREGVASLMEKFGFAEISSVYMIRSKSPFVPNRLLVKPASRRLPILVASGPASELEPVLRRMISVMRESRPKEVPVVTPRRHRSTGRSRPNVFAARQG